MSTKLSSLQTIVLDLNFLLFFLSWLYALTLRARSITTSLISSSSLSKRWTFLSHSYHVSPGSSAIQSVRILFPLDLSSSSVNVFLMSVKLSFTKSGSIWYLQIYFRSSFTLLIFPSTLFTLSSRLFWVNPILFFNSFTSFFKLLISCIVISRLPLIIFAKFCSFF